MKTLLTLSLVCGSAVGAWAQNSQDDRQIERQVDRLKQWLKLTDEQATKAREIYKADHEAQQKLDSERQRIDKERQDKVRDILTDEQKKTYDQAGGRGGRGGGRGSGGGNTPGGGNGWTDRLIGPTFDEIQKAVELTEEQIPKVKDIVEDYRKKAQERLDELQKNGFQGFDWQAEMETYRKSLEDLGAKIKEHLTDSQKEKLDKLIQSRTQPFGGFGRRGNNGQGNNGTGPGPNRGATVESRVKSAMDALKIEKQDEAAVVEAAVKKVAEAQHALDQYERDSRTALDTLAKNKNLGEDEVQAKLKELRTGRKEKESAVKAAQKELAELVSFRQEVELIRQNILR